MTTTKELVYIVRDEKGEIMAMVHQDMEKRKSAVYRIEELNAEDIAELIGGQLPAASKV